MSADVLILTDKLQKEIDKVKTNAQHIVDCDDRNEADLVLYHNNVKTYGGNPVVRKAEDFLYNHLFEVFFKLTGETTDGTLIAVFDEKEAKLYY